MDPCLVDHGSWTDEKHMHFLNFLESSFLHAMFGPGCRCGCGGRGEGGGVRLDRELPDTCESTRDSESQKTHLSKGMGITNKPKRSMRSSSSSTSKRRFGPSNDQVVPRLARILGDDDDDDDDDEEDEDEDEQTKDVGPN